VIGEDIYNVDLHEFAYPDGDSAHTASILLYDDDNPALVKNKEVKYYTRTAQVLAKIIFYNLLPKLGEYSHAMGSTPLLIYCFLKGIRVNILILIIDYMTSDHLLVPNWHLPFGMLITRLLKQLRFDLFTERSIEQSFDINNTFSRGCVLGSVLLLLSTNLSYLLLLQDLLLLLLLPLIHI